MIFFMADPHFGCENLIANTRPEFMDAEEHDNHLIYTTNRKVGRNDRLIILGDFCHEKPGRYRPRIECRHVEFVIGNHDRKKLEKLRKVFGRLWEQRTVKLATGEKVVCTHHPQAFWDGCHNGTYHAYGHIHACHEREGMMNKGMPGRRSMDVGADSAKRLLGDYEPFSELEFLYLLQGQDGHDIIRRT
jgi:calcineurin-like phosphoesterase family protein